MDRRVYLAKILPSLEITFDKELTDPDDKSLYFEAMQS